MPPSSDSLDPSTFIVCEKCRNHYVVPKVRTRGPLTGVAFKDCLSCRGRVKKADLPSYLIIPEHLRQQKSGTDAEQEQTPVSTSTTLAASEVTSQNIESGNKPADLWLASMTDEQLSVLVLPHSLKSHFSANSRLRDFPHALPAVQWESLPEGLSAIYAPEDLFKGHENVFEICKVGLSKVAPIGYLTIALNTVAANKNLPFKLSWLDIPMKDGMPTLFMALNAWSPEDRTSWAHTRPSERLNRCSVWETKVLDDTATLALSYQSLKSLDKGQDGKFALTPSLRNSLVWIEKVKENRSQASPGELVFAGGQRLVTAGLCSTSADLLNLLIEYFREQPENSKQTWSHHKQEALKKLHRSRAPKADMRAACADLVYAKRHPEQTD